MVSVKRDELSLYIAQNNPDIIGVSEAFPKRVMDPVQLLEVHMDGYEFFCQLRLWLQRSMLVY